MDDAFAGLDSDEKPGIPLAEFHGAAAPAKNPFEGLDAAPTKDPFEALDAPPPPGIMARAGAAAGRIGQAAAEGFGSGPVGLKDVISPQAYDWLQQHRIISEQGALPGDALLRGTAILGDLAARGASAGFKAGQQSIQELGQAVGLSEQHARELAAIPEAFPMEIPGLAERGAAAAAARDAREPITRAPAAPAPATPEPALPPTQGPIPAPAAAAETLADIAQGKPVPPPVQPPAQAPPQAALPHPVPAPPPEAPPHPGLPEAPEPPPLAPDASGAWEPPPREKPGAAPPSLNRFLAANGGIRDQGGDLRAAGADKTFIPGMGKLVRKNGLPLDYAREKAEEAGFLPPNSTISDLIDRVKEEVSGRPQYKPEDEAIAQQRLMADAAEHDWDQFNGHRQDLSGLGQRMGVWLTAPELDHAATMVMDGEHPEAAIEQARRYSESVTPGIAEMRRGPNGDPVQMDALAKAIRSGDAARGADAITGRLMTEANLGRLPPASAKEVSDFVGFLGSHMVNGVGLRIMKDSPNGPFGAFDPLSKTVAIFNKAIDSGTLPRVAVHELWHAMDAALPGADRAALGREYASARDRYTALNPWAKPLLENGGELHGDAAVNWYNRFSHNPDTASRVDLGQGPEGPAVRMRYDADNYRLQNPREYFAENMADRYFQDQQVRDPKARGVFSHVRDIWQRMVAGLQRLWGGDATGRIYQGFKAQKYAPPEGAGVGEPMALPRPPQGAQEGLFGEPAAPERQRAGAEPTIRNDPRQIGLPGTEPSAVQAQAARDQAGRGALLPKGTQKAPDEGLFAPKQPDENPLLMAVSPKQRQTEMGLKATQAAFAVVKDMTGFRRALAEVEVALSPTALKGAALTEDLIRGHGGASARAYDQATHALQAVRDVIDRADKADQIEFTDRMERGLPQPTPELTKLAAVLRGALDGWGKKVQGLGKGYLSNLVQDYMGHIYGNYREWAAGQRTDPTQAQMQGRALASGMSKSPLRGSGNFLKQRTFATQKDAMAAGLVPVTYNPVDMQLMKIREMQKFYYGTRLADSMKQTGIAKWLTPGDYRWAQQNGLRPLDDRVFQPSLVQEGVPGIIEPGKWFAPEPAERLFNRYMSRGLAGNSIIYDTMRVAGNALNMAQLGLSGFHATFIMADTAMSDMALGISQVMRGKPAGAGRMLSAAIPGISQVRTLMAGSKLKGAWFDPSGADALWQRTANDMMIGGGRSKMDTFYHTNASGAFFKTWADIKNPAGVFHDAAQMFRDAPGPFSKAIIVPVKLAGRALEQISEPLMGQLVPRAKMGVFAQLAQDWHERNPGATPEARASAMKEHWDAVDDRMGQMVYDNIFWNKTTKDVAFLVTRSVGWNLGTLRLLGGSVIDTGKIVTDMIQGRAPKLTTRMAYAMGLTAITAQMGAIATYLATGKGPQSTMDYMYPPDGAGGRRSLPGYSKDVMNWTRAPLQTAINKANPLLSEIWELGHNRDYYGGSIWDPERDPGPAQAYGDYLLNTNAPFSFLAWRRMMQQGVDPTTAALAWLGIQPAPAAITSPGRTEKFQARDARLAYRKRLREPGHVNPFTRSP